jgi:hypothetical protein
MNKMEEAQDILGNEEIEKVKDVAVDDLLADEKAIDAAAAKLANEKAAEEAAKRAKVSPPEKEVTTMVVHKRHLCSWCGGYNQHIHVKKEDLDPELREKAEVVVKHKILEIPSQHGGKGKVIICNNCEFKIFNSGLGQARFLGQELTHLRGDNQAKGFFPV